MSRIRQSAIVGMLVLLCAARVAFAQGAGGPAQFSLQGLNGQVISSDSLRGEVVVLAFGASWLPLSRNQLQSLKKLADEYADRGVAVYWVSTESENPKSKNFASNDQLRALAQRYSVTALRDPDGAVSRKLGVDQIPAIVILDKQGNVAGEPTKGTNPDGNLAAQIGERLKKIL